MLKKCFIVFSLLIVTGMSQDVQQIVDKIWSNMGGMENYHAAQQVTFTFVVKANEEVRVKRNHIWNRNSGDYVLTFYHPDSQATYAVYFNVNNRGGTVFRDKVNVSGQEKNKLLEYAYGVFINDTYWLLLPAKLRDPGVRVQIDNKKSSETDHAVLHLSFDNVGLTPGDQYWLYIDNSGQIVRWEYHLQSDHKGDFMWEPARECGADLRFSIRKISTENNRIIEFQNVSFSREVELNLFHPDHE